MLHPRHEFRPTAAELLQNPLLRSRQQIQLDELQERVRSLEAELRVEREKNKQLEQQAAHFAALTARVDVLAATLSDERIAEKVCERLEGRLGVVKDKQTAHRRESE